MGKQRTKSLQSAMSQGDLPYVRSLVEKEGIENVKNEKDQSALILSTLYMKDEIQQYLLSLPDINIDHQDRDGNTALMHSVIKTARPGIFARLLEAEADTTLRNRQGYSAAMLALLGPDVEEEYLDTMNQHKDRFNERDIALLEKYNASTFSLDDIFTYENKEATLSDTPIIRKIQEALPSWITDSFVQAVAHVYDPPLAYDELRKRMKNVGSWSWEDIFNDEYEGENIRTIYLKGYEESVPLTIYTNMEDTKIERVEFN